MKRSWWVFQPSQKSSTSSLRSPQPLRYSVMGYCHLMAKLVQVLLSNALQQLQAPRLRQSYLLNQGHLLSCAPWGDQGNAPRCSWLCVCFGVVTAPWDSVILWRFMSKFYIFCTFIIVVPNEESSTCRKTVLAKQLLLPVGRSCKAATV